MRNIIAVRTETGYTGTLTTLALQYLTEAEILFGQRTTDYTYGGVEFNQNGPPCIWFPSNKFVIVQLTQSTAFDLTQGIFQLSHEIVHVISPNGQPTTNNLEEGLATWFSKMITDRDSGNKNYAGQSINGTKYLRPYNLADILMNMRPDAIRELRKIQPVMGKITKSDFAKSNLDLPHDLVDELVQPMEY